jgi:hypothetical protein
MPLWAMNCLEELARLLITLLCRLIGVDMQTLDGLLDLAEELEA